MVIVTQNQYILASKIHHITLDEKVDHNEVRSSNGRYRTVIDRYYQLSVIYTPEDSTPSNQLSSSRNDVRECSVILRGSLNAYMVFRNLIQQIREQMPDKLYLDTALERMIADMDVEALKDKDLEEDKCVELEVKNDRSTKKVRRAGKAKRRNKKVLRRAKASNRSRKK